MEALATRLDSAFLEVRGRDRVRFIHGFTTNDVFKLATGRDGAEAAKQRLPLDRTPAGGGHVTTALNRQGRMIAAGKLRMFEDCVVLEIPRGCLPPLREHLEKAIIMDKVELADLSERFAHWYVWGRDARDAVPFAPDVPEFHFEVRGDTLVSPFRMTGSPGFDVVVPVAKAGGAVRAPEGALEPARIEHGWPRWGADMDASMLPMEAGLEPVALSWTKGCYLGQEVVLRVRNFSEPVRMMVQLAVDGNAPPPGTPVVAEGAEIGRVTSAAGRVALAVVRKSHKDPGTVVEAGGARAAVRDLPWRRELTGSR
jgi:hypothetical protein